LLVSKAIELDDSLAEPYAALAYHRAQSNRIGREPKKSSSGPLRSIQEHVTAHHWHAYNLISMGRSQEAIAALERARKDAEQGKPDS